MKFEVTTMLPVHSTAVKRRLLKLLSSAWLLVYRRRFSIKMMSLHPPQSRNMTSYVVRPFGGFKSMGVKVIKTQEMCKL